MPQAVNRTLCVGLGGTGRDVLMRVRRLIVDRYGSLDNFPIVSFLHIDTDVQGSQITDLGEGRRYRGVDISFRPSEQVPVTISQEEIDLFIRNCRNRPNNRIGPYDHILQWFDPQLLHNGRGIEQGANGIRAIGRLAFFWNFDKVKVAVEQAKDRTQGHEAFMLQNYGLNVDPTNKIFVTGSLCGGTGSGMFLDMAYFLKDTYAGNTVIGHLIISPELYSSNPSSQMQASTYAALLELDHYSQAQTRFQVLYSLADITQQVDTANPPFDFLYLVSRSTRGNQFSVQNKATLCNIIAHAVSLDFYSEVGVQSQGKIDNVKDKLAEEDHHPCGSCQQYLTFGLASIYYPHNRIYNIALKTLIRQLLDFWRLGLKPLEPGQSVIQDLLDEFTRATWGNDLQQALKAVSIEGPRNANQLLQSWRQQQASLITNCKNRDDRRQMLVQLQRNFTNQFNKVAPSLNDNNRGPWLQAISRSNRGLIEDYKARLDQFLIDLLNPNHGAFGLRIARNWLEAVMVYCDQEKQTLQAQQEQVKESPATQIDRHSQELQSTVEDLEKRLMGKTVAIREQCQDTVQRVYKVIENNLQATLIQESLQTLRELRSYSQQHFDRINEYLKQVEAIQGNLDKEIETIRNLGFEMTGEAIFEEEDINRCFHALLPPGDREAELKRLSLRLLDKIQTHCQSFYEILQRPAGNDRETLYKDIHDYLPQEVLAAGQGSMEPVIKRFLRKYGSNSATRLQQILQESQCLLPLTVDEFAQGHGGAAIRLVGFKDDNGADTQEFRHHLGEAGIGGVDIVPIQAEDEILFMHQEAAFPLRLIHNLKAWESHYYMALNSDRSKGLNTDVRLQTQLDPLIPPDLRHLEEIEDLFFPCIALNKLTMSEPWKNSLKKIARRRDLYDTLKEQYQALKEEIQAQPQYWSQVYEPQFAQFEQSVQNLQPGDTNYGYRRRLLDNREGVIDRPGVLSRVRSVLEQLLTPVPLPPTRPPGDPVFLIPQSQPVSKPDVVEISRTEIIDSSWVDSPIGENKTEQIRANEQTRAERRRLLQSLKADLDDGVITQEEYNDECEQVRKQYPLK